MTIRTVAKYAFAILAGSLVAGLTGDHSAGIGVSIGLTLALR
jgi:hypothetical protein